MKKTKRSDMGWRETIVEYMPKIIDVWEKGFNNLGKKFDELPQRIAEELRKENEGERKKDVEKG